MNGIPLDAEGLAKLIGESPEDIRQDLDELERHGVFSRRKNGCIYSRRMVRDEEKRRKLRENGKKGGNPTLCSKSEKECLDNQQDITTEARSQKLEVSFGSKDPPDITPGHSSDDESSEPRAKPTKVAKFYVFEGRTIRLTGEDFGRWKSSFAALDLAAELAGLDGSAARSGA